MAGPNETGAGRFQLCYFADVYYGSHPSWPTGNEPPTVIEVPHEPDSRFVLTLEIATSVSGPNADTKFCIGENGETEDGAALTGYIDVAFVLAERAPIVPGGPVDEVTTEAVYSQRLIHRHYQAEYDAMMLSLRDDEPEVNAVGVLFGGKEPSAADEAALVMQIRTRLSELLYQAVGRLDEDRGEVVGATSVDMIEQDFSACLMSFTYDVYLEAINGAIARLRELCQNYESEKNRAQGAKYYQRNRFARGRRLQDAENMASTYVYSPLDLSKDSVRLLRLCKGDPGTEIRCELLESFLSESEGVPYEALSYTWGGELTGNSPWVLLDEVEVPVTENLFEALHSLRLESLDRLMWVDALCINQDDHREKGHQVGQMRHVYRNAETVLVWLGPSSPEVDDLMDMMTEWGQISNQQEQRLSNIETLWTASNLLEGSGIADYESHKLTLGRLLKRPWFWRVWVIQEVANARCAVIICGSKSVSSRVFSAMPYLMELEMHTHTKAVMDVMPGPLRRQSWWNNDRRLITLLVKFNGSQATQQHDRIYALFGIASDAPDLPITYGCPFQDVFAQIISLLTLGDVSQSHCFGDQSPFRFQEVFSRVGNGHELVFRLFEIALQHREEVLAKQLIGASDLDAKSYDAISLYGWYEPYYRSVFALYTGIHQQDYGSLTALFHETLYHLHYLVCIDLFEIFGYVPDDCELNSVTPYIPSSVFQIIIKPILIADPLRLTSIAAQVLRSGSPQQLQVLLEHSLVGDMVLDDNWLKASFSNPSDEMLKFLLERRKAAGAEGISVTDILWEVVLGAYHVSMLDTLIDCGADIHAKRPKYGTPLQEAIHSGRLEVSQILAKRGADLNSREENGDTLLHYVEQRDPGTEIDDIPEFISILLLYGADEMAKDIEGRTPWQRNTRNFRGAERRDEEEMLKLFSPVKKEDLPRYLGLLQGREGDDSRHRHSGTLASTKRRRDGEDVGDPDDCQSFQHRSARKRPGEKDLACTRTGGL